MSLRSNADDVGQVDYDEATATYRSMHDWERPARLSLTIVQTVATATGTDHESMEPLYSVLDPDALDALLSSPRENDLRLTFPYEGCIVMVESNGEITVRRGE